VNRKEITEIKYGLTVSEIIIIMRLIGTTNFNIFH